MILWKDVFTFAGIQSSKGETYDRDTDKVYNNIYPDKPFTSGLVIPKSLAYEEDRPVSQLKTHSYRKRRMKTITDYKKQFKKPEREHKQREKWEEMEKAGKMVKKWYKNEPERKKQAQSKAKK